MPARDRGDRRPAPGLPPARASSTSSTAPRGEPSERDIPPSQKADGQLPAAPGLSALDAARRATAATSTVSADVRRSWLPAPYPASRSPRPRRLALRRRHPRPARAPTTSVTAAGLAYDATGAGGAPRPRRDWSPPPPAPRSIFAREHRAALDAAALGGQPGEERDRTRTEPVREGGDPAALVPRGRRLHLLPRHRRPAAALDQLELFLGTGRGQPARATASSSPRRWR